MFQNILNLFEHILEVSTNNPIVNILWYILIIQVVFKAVHYAIFTTH